MGTDFHAYAVVGVKLDSKKLFRKVKAKAFEHNHPETMKFDPETGRKLWEDYEEAIIDLPDNTNAERKNWKMGNGTQVDLFVGTDGRPLYLGFGVRTESSRNGASYAFGEGKNILDSNADKIKDFLKSKLEPSGLWDEKAFGLYAILFCSY